jgi:NAD(P)-dependent dehydrogenase (short-subunit alcohol dehydrogenase family)
MSVDGTSGSIVITGASTGIGRACALRLDRLGYRVYAGVRKAEDAACLQELASERLLPIMLDVTDPGSIAAARDEVAARIGQSGLDGLVNNAGIAVGGPLEFTPIAEMRRQLEVNVVGMLAVTQAFLPLLRQARGRIVNISSVAGYFATPFMGPYDASKHAVEGMSDALRLELQPWGMRVVLVEPGEIATPIWAKSLATAEDTLRTLPPQATQLYGTMIDYMFAYVKAIQGIPADEVAKVVAKALTARAPHARYRVGRDAHVGRILSRLPDGLRDRLILRRLPRDEAA